MKYDHRKFILALLYRISLYFFALAMGLMHGFTLLTSRFLGEV